METPINLLALETPTFQQALKQLLSSNNDEGLQAAIEFAIETARQETPHSEDVITEWARDIVDFVNQQRRQKTTRFGYYY